MHSITVSEGTNAVFLYSLLAQTYVFSAFAYIVSYLHVGVYLAFLP